MTDLRKIPVNFERVSSDGTLLVQFPRRGHTLSPGDRVMGFGGEHRCEMTVTSVSGNEVRFELSMSTFRTKVN